MLSEICYILTDRDLFAANIIMLKCICSCLFFYLKCLWLKGLVVVEMPLSCLGALFSEFGGMLC
jgi:hypothetical protein